MPILSTFGAASYAGLHPYSNNGGFPAATYYFFAAVDNLWLTLGNWFSDTEHSTATGTFPDSSISVHVLSDCTIDLDSVSFVAPGAIEIAGNNVDTTPADGYDDGYVLTLYSTEGGYLPETVNISGDGWLDLDGGGYGAPL